MTLAFATVKRQLAACRRWAAATFSSFVLIAGLLPAGTVHAAGVLAAPVNVRAFTGGNNIALLWEPAAGTTPSSYYVYRNGVKVATVAQANNNTAPVLTTRYYDSNISRGVTYQYQVASVGYGGMSDSLLTAPVFVTHPSNPTPVPSITVSTSVPRDLRNWVNSGKTLLQTWYPKYTAALDAPDYSAPTRFTITTQKNLGYAAYVIGTTMYIDEDYARSVMNKPNGINLVLHEGMHIAQQYQGNVPMMVTEGVADWAKGTMFHDVELAAPGYNDVYSDGYDKSAYFLSWVASTYNQPNLIHAINVAAHNGTYSGNIFVQYTGKTTGQLWTEMTGVLATSIGSVANAGSGKCADVLYYNTTNGNTIQIVPCVGNTAQQWVYVAASQGAPFGALHALGKCMRVANSGTADGTKVVIWDCDGSLDEAWMPQADGSLLNIMSGKCLQPTNGSSTDNTPLEISTCNGSAMQRWALPSA